MGNAAVPRLAAMFVNRVFDDYEKADFNHEPGFLHRQERRAKVSLTPFSDEGRDLEDAANELIDALEHDQNLRHPRFYGFIPGPAQSVSWLGDAIAMAYNPHVGGWNQAPGASSVEKQVIAWANSVVGLDSSPHAGGIIQSGGSVAGLTVLTAARDKYVAEQDIPKAVAYLTRQTHSALKKALHIIGIGSDNIRFVEHDDQQRMVIDDLETQIRRDRAAGRVPFVVIGTCGTTNTGAIDPLNAIADVCAREDLWFHCDGAYGASVVLSDRAHLAAGIERADSVVWDGHKWLFQVYGCGLVLVRDQRDLIRSYSAGGEYLQDIQGVAPDPDWWDLGPELTRPARAPRLWLTLQSAGVTLISEMVSQSLRRAERVEERLRGHDRFEITSPASLAIVTFTLIADTPQERARRNQELARHLRHHNLLGIFTTELDGENVLRITTISPHESMEDLDLAMDQMFEAVAELGF